MKKYRPHPAAELFPMMGDAEIDELAADIRVRGQLEPIIETGGLILDGRNRYEACRRAEVDPHVLIWEDDGSPFASPTAYVLSKNLRRRHLNESQRALAAAEALPLFEAEARKRQKNGKSSELPAEPLAPRGAKVSTGKAQKERAPKSAARAAKMVGASARSVERAKAVLTKRPDLIQQIRAAKLTLKQAEKTIKREEQVKQAKAYVAPEGEYPVVVIDPPWSYDDQLDGSDAARGGAPYPTMTVEQIADIELPLAKDAVVFLWVTNSHLIDPEAYATVAEAWKGTYGLVPKQIRTWVKPKMGLGRVWRNTTEHLVRFERGAPVFAAVTQTTHFEAPLGPHSQKPQQSLDDIEALCPAGPRLEMFARAERKGWVTTGSELEQAPESKLPLEASLGRPLAKALLEGGITGEAVRAPPRKSRETKPAQLETTVQRIVWRQAKDGSLKGKGRSGRAYLIGDQGDYFSATQAAFAASRCLSGMGGTVVDSVAEGKNWCERQEEREWVRDDGTSRDEPAKKQCKLHIDDCPGCKMCSRSAVTR